MVFKSISIKIIELRDSDLSLRETLIQRNELGVGYNNEMELLHIKNAVILNDLIDKIGYPTVLKVGKEASDAGWLVIQHSISMPVFMKKCLQLLEKEVMDHKADPIHLAYLKDRIAVFEGKPQFYGTQFDWDQNGELSPNPLDDIAIVNNRRKSIGLNTLEEQIELMRKQAIVENQKPPNDLVKRELLFNEWRKKTGWITL